MCFVRLTFRELIASSRFLMTEFLNIFGKYFGCTNTACKNTRKLLRNGEAAAPKSDPGPVPGRGSV